MGFVISKENKTLTNGTVLAYIIIFSWLGLITFAFTFNTYLTNLWNIPIILIMTHLYTGLFITAHDAMHGSASNNAKLNNFIGTICVLLYAGFSYKTIREKHFKHHRHVATDDDPDYHGSHFIGWFFKFMLNYIGVVQIIALAIVYNILNRLLSISSLNLILFWILPSLLSSIQLFYFGTYLPHKNPETINNKHRSRSLNVNAFWGFISCYFFGYHFEHHSNPGLPWWKLWKEKA